MNVRSSSMSRRRLVALSAGLPALMFGASACGSSSSSAPGGAGGGAKLGVVTSTEIYADLVKRIGGDRVEVTALIPAAQDPHSFEPAAKDTLAVKKAALIVVNGGGYDSFLTKIADGESMSEQILDAVAVSGLPGASDAAKASTDAHAHTHFNEHVWYSFAAVKKIAAEIKSRLAAKDTSGEQTYSANLDALLKELEGLVASAEALKPAARGQSALLTEPVPGYLFESIGLKDATDEKLTEAVEEGSDIPAQVFAAAKAQLTGHSVTILALNSQTASPQTQQLADTAKAAGVPVLTLTETMPEGQSYVEWMKDNLARVSAALKGSK